MSNAEFAAMYQKAREVQAAILFDDTLQIADDPTIPSDQKRVMVDTRKWYLSRVLPKVYGNQTAAAMVSTTQTVADLVRLVEGRRGPKVFDVKAQAPGGVEALPEESS